MKNAGRSPEVVKSKEHALCCGISHLFLLIFGVRKYWNMVAAVNIGIEWKQTTDNSNFVDACKQETRECGFYP